MRRTETAGKYQIALQKKKKLPRSQFDKQDTPLPLKIKSEKNLEKIKERKIPESIHRHTHTHIHTYTHTYTHTLK